MAEQLFALQRDLDMIATQVNNLTRALSDLDLILKRTDDLTLEQKFQAAQMRRIEGRLHDLEKNNKEITRQVRRVEDRLYDIEKGMTAIKGRIDQVEKLLLLICEKLQINPAV